jgi:hypothetical protein
MRSTNNDIRPQRPTVVYGSLGNPVSVRILVLDYAEAVDHVERISKPIQRVTYRRGCAAGLVAAHEQTAVVESFFGRMGCTIAPVIPRITTSSRVSRVLTRDFNPPPIRYNQWLGLGG